MDMTSEIEVRVKVTNFLAAVHKAAPNSFDVFYDDMNQMYSSSTSDRNVLIKPIGPPFKWCIVTVPLDDVFSCSCWVPYGLVSRILQEVGE